MRRYSCWSFLLVAMLVLMLTVISCGQQPSPAPAAPKDAAKAGEPAKDAKAPEAAKAATDYPTGPVRMIVSRGAGGSNDAIARLTQPYFSKYLGVPVNVENVTGAGGAVGNNQVFKAKPDGYTILCTTTISDIIKQVAEGTPYDFRQFTPIYNIGGGDSNLIAVKADSDIKDFKDYVEKAKAAPNGITLGGLSGINVTSIGMAFMVKQAGIPAAKLRYIPYEDGKQAILSTLSGEIQSAITQPSNVRDQVSAKKMRCLVIWTKDRVKELPDTPAFLELYPGASNYYDIFQSIMGPPNMPKEVVAKLTTALEKATSDPDYVKKASQVFTLSPMGPDKLRTELESFFKQAEEMKPLLLQVSGSGADSKK